jgi:hypothetical protein
MSTQDLGKAKSPELRASLTALRRAAALARKTAIQTDTDLVIVKDGKLVRISADQLRREAQVRKPA